MYIRGLIPWNFAELAEAVSIRVNQHPTNELTSSLSLTSAVVTCDPTPQLSSSRNTRSFSPASAAEFRAKIWKLERMSQCSCSSENFHTI